MVILLGNYLPDQQESMQRFAALLYKELRDRQVEVRVVRPRTVWGGFGRPDRGLAKWCGYVDKLILFPMELRRQVRAWSAARHSAPPTIHICDQANAVYIPLVEELPHLVTCCDLLAVRSALGEFHYHRTRWSGRRLQAGILSGLNRAGRVTCISQATRSDVLRLTQVRADRTDVTHMGLNYPYRPMPNEEARARVERLCQARGTTTPASFLLHVGGNQWYKNRRGLLEIYQCLSHQSRSVPPLVMAGKPLPPALERYISERRLNVLALRACDNEDLRALYSLARWLVFPSLEEGFGWPIIEAQACGCPVITTRKAPMTEVGSAAAAYLDPTQPELAAVSLREALAESEDAREARIEAGLRNAASYSTEAMIEKYLEIYQCVSCTPSIPSTLLPAGQ